MADSVGVDVQAHLNAVLRFDPSEQDQALALLMRRRQVLGLTPDLRLEGYAEPVAYDIASGVNELAEGIWDSNAEDFLAQAQQLNTAELPALQNRVQRMVLVKRHQYQLDQAVEAGELDADFVQWLKYLFSVSQDEVAGAKESLLKQENAKKRKKIVSGIRMLKESFPELYNAESEFFAFVLKRPKWTYRKQGQRDDSGSWWWIFILIFFLIKFLASLAG